MDELINTFINTYLTEESKQDIIKSFRIFNDFEFTTVEQDLIDVLVNQGSITNIDLVDQFIAVINKKLDYVISQHDIKLIPDATISEKNDILTTLFNLQHLEDYTGIIRILEADVDKIETIVTILSEFTLIPDTRLMVIIDDIKSSTLDTLKTYIYNKEKSQETPIEVDEKLNKQLKLFFSCFPKAELGRALAETFKINEPFKTYIPFVSNHLVDTDNSITALNLLTVIYMSSDGYMNPMEMYREHSMYILQDLNKISAVEVYLISHIGRFNEYMKVQNEKNRLSETSDK